MKKYLNIDDLGILVREISKISRKTPNVPIYFERDGQKYEEFYLFASKYDTTGSYLYIGVEDKGVYPLPEEYRDNPKYNWLSDNVFPEDEFKILKKHTVKDFAETVSRRTDLGFLSDILMSEGSLIFNQKFDYIIEKDKDGNPTAVVIRLLSYEKNRYEKFIKAGKLLESTKNI